MNWLSMYVAETIALCALTLTTWHAHTQRQHNKISLKPHLFTFNTRDKTNNVARLEALLTNNGLGPAFIKKYQVFLNGQPYEAEAAVKLVLGDLSKNASHTILGDDYAMRQNEVKTLLSVSFHAHSWDEIEAVENRLDKLDLLINYSSAYGEKCVLDTRKDV
jgi:hypothetical protein